MEFLYLIFYACQRLQFLDVETNPGGWCPVPAARRILCSNVRSLTVNFSDLTEASSWFLYCCAPRLWSHIYITCRSSWFPDSVALSCCGGKMPRAWGIASYVRDGYGVEMYRMLKFWDPRKRMHMWISVHEDPREWMHMQISKDGDPRRRISVQEYPRMRIFGI